MKTKWDYTDLAESYLKRPNYASNAIIAMFKILSQNKSMTACDIGAGVAHLTLELAPFFSAVNAIEPNLEMRRLGIHRTRDQANVTWFEGTGEATAQKANQFDLCTFGSSFNVCDRVRALVEVKRILKPNGWFACMWNHRDLGDPIQSTIEEIIKSNIEEYGYGQRREDQTSIIKESGFFKDIIRIEADVTYDLSVEEVVTAWRSHASLQRQAGQKFNKIINEISNYFESNKCQKIKTPYTTRIWIAQLKE